jgi:hypothetical protein
MTLALSILFFALCASAQDIMPPMPMAVPAVIQHKAAKPQPIVLSWSPSPSPDVTGYAISGSTNGVIFESTNVAGTSCQLLAWPGTNLYTVQTLNSAGLFSIPAKLTHSGWNHDIQFALAVLTNGVLTTNAFTVDSTNLQSPSYLRTAIESDSVVLQISPDLVHWSGLFASDIDNFPAMFSAKVSILKSLVNIP